MIVTFIIKSCFEISFHDRIGELLYLLIVFYFPYVYACLTCTVDFKKLLFLI